MGYYRSLYTGPVIVLGKPTADREKMNAFYKASRIRSKLQGPNDHPSKSDVFSMLTYYEILPEDALCELQRIIEGDCNLAPNNSGEFKKKFNRELSTDVNQDPAFLIDFTQITAEKEWLAENHAANIEILRQYFETVEIGWAVVIDGS